MTDPIEVVIGDKGYDSQEVVAAVENNPDHLWYPYLGTLRAPTAAPTF